MVCIKRVIIMVLTLERNDDVFKDYAYVISPISSDYYLDLYELVIVLEALMHMQPYVVRGLVSLVVIIYSVNYVVGASYVVVVIVHLAITH